MTTQGEVDPLANLDDLIDRTPQAKIVQRKKNVYESPDVDEDSIDDFENEHDDKALYEERKKIYNEWVLKPFLLGMFGAIGMSVGKFKNTQLTSARLCSG
jgi:hypothetical protein